MKKVRFHKSDRKRRVAGKERKIERKGEKERSRARV